MAKKKKNNGLIVKKINIVSLNLITYKNSCPGNARIHICKPSGTRYARDNTSCTSRHQFGKSS